MPIKDGWRDAFLVLRNFSQSNKHVISFHFLLSFVRTKQKLFRGCVISHWRKPGNELATFAIKSYRKKLHQIFNNFSSNSNCVKIIQKKTTPNILKSDSNLPKKNFFICFNGSPSKMIKNAFYFILKSLFVLKTFKFLSWLFGHVEKATWLER